MWRSTLGLQWARVPLPWLILRATVYAVAACVAGALITALLFVSAVEWENEDVIRATFRGSAAAVWFAPSVILLTQLSPAVIIPALIAGGQRHPHALHALARPPGAAGRTPAGFRPVRRGATPGVPLVEGFGTRTRGLVHGAIGGFRGAASPRGSGRHCLHRRNRHVHRLRAGLARRPAPAAAQHAALVSGAGADRCFSRSGSPSAA